MTKLQDEILSKRSLFVELPDVTAFTHEDRYVISNAEELESIFSAYEKVYGEKPFVGMGIDLYWEERKQDGD
jgi:hypothetical protein